MTRQSSFRKRFGSWSFYPLHTEEEGIVQVQPRLTLAWIDYTPSRIVRCSYYRVEHPTLLIVVTYRGPLAPKRALLRAPQAQLAPAEAALHLNHRCRREQLRERRYD